MSEWKGFDKLDLTGVEAQTSMRLQSGKYIVRCSNAEVKASENSSRNRMLALQFDDEAGNGDIRVNLNIHHSSEQAQEIALRQLKSFLEEAGHPNPDKPGDVKSLVGLTVGIVVGFGKPWTDRDGKSRTSTEVKRFLSVDKIGGMRLGPDGAQPPATAANASGRAAGGINDEIPF